MVMLLHKFNWKAEVIEASEPVLVDFWASCHPPLAKPGIRGFFSGYGMFCVSSVVESINL
jgi:hypothetical protein